MKPYFLTLLTLLVISCKEVGLNSEKIDFETRKIVLSTWSDFENPILTRKSQTEKKLYKFYETRINEYQNELIKNFSHYDTMTNYKSIWLLDIKKRRKEKLEKSDDPENEDFLIFYPTSEDEYESIMRSIDFRTDLNKRRLDSIKGLYKKVSEKTIYHEINYEIHGFSKRKNSELIQNLRVWIDNDSNIFDHLFLDLPQIVE